MKYTEITVDYDVHKMYISFTHKNIGQEKKLKPMNNNYEKYILNFGTRFLIE